MAGAMVVYESMFGHTRQVAVAIASALPCESVALHEVGAAPVIVPDEVELLVVGGPTHAFSMSRPATRADAQKQSGRPNVSQRIGVREWLELLDAGSNVQTAAFDTHVEHPKMLRHIGSAAASIDRRLQLLGLRPCCEPEHFWVEATLGPLADGQLEHAREWASALHANIVTT
ncbi:MAG: flavodoxin [Thermoleophilia bacterium]|nr:flavodoxin [Thermoleophilia bacterium]